MTARNHNFIHGHARSRTKPHSRTYQSWMSMKERCDSPSHKSYDCYGGRGISYCKRWDKFAHFLADMGVRPDGMTLGRVENDGNYMPSNCEWQTPKKQARNRRTTRYLSHAGKSLSLIEWSEIVGVSDDTITKRLDSGWSISKTLTTPLRPMLPRGQNKRGNQYSKYRPAA